MPSLSLKKNSAADKSSTALHCDYPNRWKPLSRWEMVDPAETGYFRPRATHFPCSGSRADWFHPAQPILGSPSSTGSEALQCSSQSATQPWGGSISLYKHFRALLSEHQGSSCVVDWRFPQPSQLSLYHFTQCTHIKKEAHCTKSSSDII